MIAQPRPMEVWHDANWTDGVWHEGAWRSVRMAELRWGDRFRFVDDMPRGVLSEWVCKGFPEFIVNELGEYTWAVTAEPYCG